MTSIAAGLHPWSTSSSGSVNSVCNEDIENVKDFDEVFDLSEIMGVDMGGLDEIDDMKERLQMHLRKNESGNIKTVITESMVDTHKEDCRKRDKIRQVLGDCRRTLSAFERPEQPGRKGKRGSHAIEDLLKVEGAAKGFEIDFKEKISSLEKGECVIVVSGETSAGKSSVLNLLFEKDVLPVHHNSCTSVITRISYGDSYLSTVIMNSGEVKTFTDPDRIKEDLWEMIYVKDEAGRDMVSDIKEVNMKIPAPILQCGVVFVDSPGIGENEAMDSVIADYVEANEINGFMYVIKSDNSGGVEEDRLISLVKLILEKQNKKAEEGMMPFNPESAIFVCNRWDLVTRDSSGLVYNNAVSLLRDCWPGLEEEQIIRFSTFRAEMEQKLDKDYVTNEYKFLLENIRYIYTRAVQKRIESTYRWIERVLARSVHHLKTMVKRLDSNEQSMEDKMVHTYEKLNHLKQNSSAVLAELKVKVHEKYSMLCDEFRTEFKKHGTRVALTQWIKSETPEVEDGQTWNDIKEEINVRISKRISDEMIRWEKETGNFQSMEDMVVNDIKIQLRFLQYELEAIESEIQDNESVSPDIMYTGRRRLTLGNTQQVFKVSLDNKTQDIHMPVRLASRIAPPVTSFMEKVRKSVLWDPTEKKIQIYQNDPCKVMKQRTEKLLNLLVSHGKNDETLFQYIRSWMNRPVLYLELIEKNIPALIDANEQLLDHVAMCRVDAKESRALYEKMMEGLENLKVHLTQYGQGHIFVDDFMNDQIRVREDINIGTTATLNVSDMILNTSSYREANRRSLPRGLWTALQCAFLKRDRQDLSVTIKIYLQSAGVEQTFPEVSKLRFLEHDSVAKFLGVHHSDSPSPAFVYDNHLKSVKRYLRSTLANIREETERIVYQTASGLEYLHRKNLVHMELNTQTITVDPDGMVKLTGGCLPRCASFPLDKEKVQVGDFVYLSPSVLRGELYISVSDVYSFGLFLLEVVAGVTAYEEFRKYPLDQFTTIVNPTVMLDLENSLSKLSVATKDLICRCLDSSKDKRPGMSDIIDLVSTLGNDVNVVSNKSRRHRAPVNRNKRCSIDTTMS
ncbi:uncharacterized protein LOC132555397 [Ylistrum balloti]|uniref:uncharacterized protein LOC132555397 n=1 Tax=Ylistrum balloti TaxID=509963 RepID=UPI002905B782|nr:uncharacterized protein LOC132555397 [Ylistrum balloti]